MSKNNMKKFLLVFSVFVLLAGYFSSALITRAAYDVPVMSVGSSDKGSGAADIYQEFNITLNICVESDTTFIQSLHFIMDGQDEGALASLAEPTPQPCSILLRFMTLSVNVGSHSAYISGAPVPSNTVTFSVAHQGTVVVNPDTVSPPTGANFQIFANGQAATGCPNVGTGSCVVPFASGTDSSSITITTEQNVQLNKTISYNWLQKLMAKIFNVARATSDSATLAPNNTVTWSIVPTPGCTIDVDVTSNNGPATISAGNFILSGGGQTIATGTQTQTGISGTAGVQYTLTTNTNSAKVGNNYAKLQTISPSSVTCQSGQNLTMTITFNTYAVLDVQ